MTKPYTSTGCMRLIRAFLRQCGVDGLRRKARRQKAKEFKQWKRDAARWFSEEWLNSHLKAGVYFHFTPDEATGKPWRVIKRQLTARK